ncbi:MAG: bactofilin family protein [Rhodospirillales bacterium]
MFRRRKTGEEGDITPMGEDEVEAKGQELPALKPFMRAGEEQAPAVQRTGPRVELTRRLVDLPSAAGRNPPAPSYAPHPVAAPAPAVGAAPAPHEAESKKLIVGRDIKLSGEIVSCEHLVVEGSVEAALGDGKLIDIAESGNFRGNAECDTATIRGKFEGELTCRDRLVVRSTGRVIGKLRYHQLEVERGGEISGEVQMLRGDESHQGSVTPIFGESGNGQDKSAAATSD